MIEDHMAAIERTLARSGLPGMRLTLVARHPTALGRYIVKSDDGLRAVITTLHDAVAREQPLPAPPALGGEGGG